MRPRAGVAMMLAALVLSALPSASAVPATSPSRGAVATSPASAPASAPSRDYLQRLLDRQQWSDTRVTTPEGWFAKPIRRVAPPALPAEVANCYILTLDGPISNITYRSLSRRAIHARAKGADLIVFRVNSPGGESGAMRDIMKMITHDLQNIRTVAWVDPEAYSAAALISIACNEIVMNSSAKLGDAMPIMIGPGGTLAEMPEKERAKFESAMKSEVRDLAERNGYSPELAESMITLTLQVWLIRNPETRELRFAYPEKLPGPMIGAPESVPKQWPADQKTPWEFLRVIDSDKTLLTMTTSETIDLLFTRHVVDTDAQLKQLYHIANEPEVLESNWSEGLVEFLTSPAVTGLLFFAAIVFGYIEMHAPGHFVFGILAGVCLAIVFGSRFLIGMAAWWEIALFVVGALLVIVELIALPGHGMLALAGGACCIVALLAMLVPSQPGRVPIPETQLDWELFNRGAMALGAAFLAAVATMMVLARFLPRMPLFSRLVLAAAPVVTAPPVAEDSPLKGIGPGAEGVTETFCHPVGKVRFGEALLDASSEGDIIPAGCKVRVLRREGMRVVIERVV